MGKYQIPNPRVQDATLRLRALIADAPAMVSSGDVDLEDVRRLRDEVVEAAWVWEVAMREEHPSCR
jgi:hypothetical protein